MQRLFHLSLLVAAALGSGFSYDRCDSSEGPSAWTGSCQVGSNLQTPINLCGATTLSSLPTPVLTNYATANPMLGLNNGHTLQFNNGLSTAPTLNVGNLAQTVGRGSNSSNITWVFAQVHLHWGRTGKYDEGSEHYMQGTRYPLEAHLVHYNSAYGSVSNAVSQADGLLVVGVFFQIGQSDVGIIQQFANVAQTLGQAATSLGFTSTLTDLYDGTGSYYTYAGGLTTPGCNAVVTWIVSTTLKNIKSTTLDTIKLASSSPSATSGSGDNTKLIAKYGNFRPLQTQSRTVWISSGNSAPCTTPTEPTFTCDSPKTTSAAFMAIPSLFLHAVGLLFAFSWAQF